MNKIIIVILALVVIGGGGFFYLSTQNVVVDDGDIHTHDDGVGEMMGDSDDHGATNEVPVEDMANDMMVNNEEGSSVLSVTYTDNGYSPNLIEISVGDTVTFLNESSVNTWPASAIHPTHTVYPGSSIGKCGTEEEGSIFDACRGVAPGESYSFTFNEVGTWGYHDHLHAAKTGKIVVK